MNNLSNYSKNLHIFPDNYAIGATKTVAFNTDVITTAGGFEQRNVNWLNPMHSYKLQLEVMSRSEVSEIVSFFKIHRGRAKPFLFKDWTDFKVKGAILQLTDRNTYVLCEQYKIGSDCSLREVRHPKKDTIKVYDESGQIPFYFDEITGEITLTKDASTEVLADFEFYNLVRFESDEVMINSMRDSRAIFELNFVEVRD